MTTSSRSTSRRVSPRTHRSAGPGRRCSADWQPRVPHHHVGSARAQGHRAPPRRRHVGRHGGGDLRARLHRAQAGVQGAHRREALPRAGAGPSRPVQRNHRCADRPPPRPRLEVRGHRAGAAQHHPLRHRGGASAASLLDIHLETGRTHQIRVHFAALHHPCCGDLTYGADPTLAKRLGLERQWLHARSLAFAHPADGRRIEITSPYPADLQHALDVLRRHDCERPERAAGAAVRRRRLRLVGPVSRVLPVADARRRSKSWPTASCGASC